MLYTRRKNNTGNPARGNGLSVQQKDSTKHPTGEKARLVKRDSARQVLVARVPNIRRYSPVIRGHTALLPHYVAHATAPYYYRCADQVSMSRAGQPMKIAHMKKQKNQS